MILVVLLLLAAAIYGSWRVWQATQFVAAPVIIGMSQQDASSTLAANHLTGDFHDEYSETVAKGLVIRTLPSAGTTLDKGTSVAAWVSLGPERHPMPKVVGLTRAAAEQAITDASLAVGKVTTAYSETVAPANVISASQKEGAELKRGTAVDLVVSKGRQPITIPSVVGQAIDDATKTLRSSASRCRCRPTTPPRFPRTR